MQERLTQICIDYNLHLVSNMVSNTKAVFTIQNLPLVPNLDCGDLEVQVHFWTMNNWTIVSMTTGPAVKRVSHCKTMAPKFI